MRLWLAFASATEEEQQQFLSRGDRRYEKKAEKNRTKCRRGANLHECRPCVSPSKAFSSVHKRLRHQIVHGHVPGYELHRIEEEVILGFVADLKDDGGFMQEIIAGVPMGELSDQVYVQRAEAEGKRVVAVPIGAASRNAAQAVAQYHGLTCHFSRTAVGDLYVIFKNNFEDFPIPLKTLFEVVSSIKESLLVC